MKALYGEVVHAREIFLSLCTEGREGSRRSGGSGGFEFFFSFFVSYYSSHGGYVEFEWLL